jgi:replicative DNA helicase
MHNGGLRPGKLYILAARPSVGKSSFVMHLLMALARQGKHGLFLSQEMESEEVVDRAVCNDARINAGSLASGRMSDDEWARAAESMEALAGLPVWVDDTPALSLLDIRGKARLIPSLRVLVLDYIQLCAPTDSKRTRTEQVGEISRGLKALSKQLGIAVIALSQLNRDVEKRAGKRPQMSDLRDSGEIEQDADGIWFLWPLREETHTDQTRRVGLDVAKNRGGQKGAFVLRFDGARQHWAESMERVDDFTQKQAGGEL